MFVKFAENQLSTNSAFAAAVQSAVKTGNGTRQQGWTDVGLRFHSDPGTSWESVSVSVESAAVTACTTCLVTVTAQESMSTDVHCCGEHDIQHTSHRLLHSSSLSQAAS